MLAPGEDGGCEISAYFTEGYGRWQRPTSAATAKTWAKNEGQKPDDKVELGRTDLVVITIN